MLEIRAVWIEIVRLQVAVCRRMRIESIVRQDNRLRVFQFGENLRFKDEITLHVVSLAGAQGGLMCSCAAGEHANAGILPVFRKAVMQLQLLFLAAELRSALGAKVIREGK